MLNETIDKIQAKLENTPSLPQKERDELMAMVNALEDEVNRLPNSHKEQAESIRRFTELSAHEATRDTKDEKLLELSLQGLESSAREFQASHPALAQAVSAICRMLSNLGI